MKTIIGIAGNIGAGKGTVTKYIVEQHSAQHVRYSHILQDVLKRMHLPYNRENTAILAQALRDTFGGAVLSQTLAKDIAQSERAIVVFEGIRKEEELNFLKSMEGFVFLFVDAPIETRYRRLVQRSEKMDDATKTFEDFKNDHDRTADKDVPSLKEYADYTIDNGGALETTHKQIDEVMNTLIGESS